MACHRSSHHQPCCCRCCCCCASSSCLHCSPHSPSATTVDLLSQAIAFSLIQSPSAAVQPAHHRHAQEYVEPRRHYPCKEEHTQPQYDFPEKQHRRRRRQQDSFYHYQQQQQQQFQPQPQSLIESLLGRIAALETTFPHLSTAPPSHSVRQQPPARKPRSPAPPHVPPLTIPRGSMRDLAARTIQTYFRHYLVRRSQALRHLRHLVTIRSNVAAIKSSLSDEPRLNPKALYQGAANLFHQLDSIQSTDPMIREGKRSIGRELLQLLEFVDGISAKRHDLFTKSVGTANKGIDVDPVTDELAVQVVDELAVFPTVSCEDDEESDERRPKARASLPKTTKKVSFLENGKGSKASVTAGLAPLSDEELIGFPEVGGSLQSSDGEKSPKGRLNSGAMVSRPLANGWPSGFYSPGLSAPLPVKMESRRDGDSRKKKGVVVV